MAPEPSLHCLGRSRSWDGHSDHQARVVSVYSKGIKGGRCTETRYEFGPIAWLSSLIVCPPDPRPPIWPLPNLAPLQLDGAPCLQLLGRACFMASALPLSSSVSLVLPIQTVQVHICCWPRHVEGVVLTAGWRRRCTHAAMAPGRSRTSSSRPPSTRACPVRTSRPIGASQHPCPCPLDPCLS